MPTVREFARLTTDLVVPTMDQATIPASAFRFLLENRLGPDGGKILRMDGPTSLRAANYVGVVETPCGTRLEILPKHTSGPADTGQSRALLVRMISQALRLKPRPGGMADLARFSLPFPEWLAALFLEEALVLVRRGMRRAYRRVEAREPYLRGAPDVARQIRHGPAGAHLFAFRHDVFSFDRPENRLIRSATRLVLGSTRSADNWRLARELSILLDDIPESTDVPADLRAWGHDRLMADYAAVLAPCELILTRQSPFSVAGPRRGLSMLFPMEKLFEACVTASLRAQTPPAFALRAQVRHHHLCLHQGKSWFQLQPDILVTSGRERWIVDAKWKLLHGNRAEGYGLRQSDFYQLFAYGHRYLDGRGDMYLVYPRTAAFGAPLPPFDMGGGLNLHVIPFDLEAGKADYPFLKAPCEVADIGPKAQMREPASLLIGGA